MDSESSASLPSLPNGSPTEPAYTHNQSLTFKGSKSRPKGDRHDSTHLYDSASSTEPSGPQGRIYAQTAENDGIHKTMQPWVQVLVGHLVMINSFGMIQSFSIFQPHYEIVLNASPSKVAWIGSIHIFFVFLLGTFSGWALDRGYYKSSLAVGSIFQLIGLLVASFSKTYWMSLVFHGVFQGIGHGLMFCPAVTMIALYFKASRMKTTAMSLSGCGSATGGMLFPIIAKYTISSLGQSCTLWIMCGVVLCTSALIVTLAQATPRETHHEKTSLKRIIECQAFKEKTYTLYVAAMFFVFAALWIPYFFVRDFSANALHVAKSKSFNFLLIMNGAGIPGRVVPALLSDCFLGTINTYIVMLFLTSVALLCWPFVSSPVGLVPWSIAFGFCAGGASSLLQAGIASLNTEPHKTGIKIGMAFSVVAFASLLGGPVGGMLIRVGESTRDGGTATFLWMQIFTGGVMLLGCVILVTARVARTGWRVEVKV